MDSVEEEVVEGTEVTMILTTMSTVGAGAPEIALSCDHEIV